MADWNTPALSVLYTSFRSIMMDRDVDAATMFSAVPTNPPTSAMRYLRASDKFQEWNGSAWIDKVLSIAGGGTGAATDSGARTALGLGSMATQNNSAVNITGGTMTGVNINASSINSGTLPLARLVNISNTEIAAAAAIAWTKVNKTGGLLSELGGTLNSTALSGTYSGSLNFTGNPMQFTGVVAFTNTITFANAVDFPNTSSASIYTLNLTGSVVGAPGGGIVGGVTILVGGVPRTLAFY